MTRHVFRLKNKYYQYDTSVSGSKKRLAKKIRFTEEGIDDLVSMRKKVVAEEKRILALWSDLYDKTKKKRNMKWYDSIWYRMWSNYGKQI